ncbi:MAG: STAS domain-containing protein [Candidatus Kapabacteria bacterium]|jgi:anti-anti-sigma factor|nr:STAS domain-containing protein [Candidatus Kapabacteria bacterium]
MKLTIENDDDIVIMNIKDANVGADIAPDLKSKVLIEAQPNIRALIFNLENVETMDSSGLGALLLANRQLRNYSIPVCIVKAQQFVKNLFAMTKIDSLFLFFDSEEQAIEYIKKNGRIN